MVAPGEKTLLFGDQPIPIIVHRHAPYDTARRHRAPRDSLIPLSHAILLCNYSRQRAEDSVYKIMVDPIAFVKGLFQAGQSGAGGQFEPLTAKTRNAFTYGMGRRIVYALDFVKKGFAPDKDTCIIDAVYDGVTIRDPHAQTPMEFFTNYPGQLDRGLWYSYFEPPRLRSFTDPGIHTVQIKVAPRKTAQYFRGRGFSPEAGGVISPVYKFEILPDPNRE